LASIGEAKKRLPKDFIDELYNQYSSGTADKILYGIAGERYVTLRVNTIRYNINDLMNYFKEINIKFERVPWYKDALVIKNAEEKDIEKLNIYKNGYIYLQSLSSMIPPLVLDPQKNEKILDLTAAPGSKTTQIAAMMNNTGYILANEIDKIRYERLKYNTNNQGATIVETLLGKGEKIGDLYPECFDGVLLDAPCSGEGRFLISNAKTYANWSKKRLTNYLLSKRNYLKADTRI
jgi:16S rRNA C967 or C1407 C5-methylase (RsmB/RsmF family)